MTIVFLKSAHEVTLRAVLEIVYVFMYTYIEAAEAENTTSIVRFSMCVVN